MLKRVGSLSKHVLRSKPLMSIRNTLIIGRSITESQYAQKHLSFCAVSGVML
jgi:hypothetical protein